MQRYSTQFRIRVPAQTRWNEETRTTDVIKPEFWARIELDINTEEIAIDLGRKAAKSKGGRSKALHGNVKAKFIGEVAK